MGPARMSRSLQCSLLHETCVHFCTPRGIEIGKARCIRAKSRLDTNLLTFARRTLYSVPRFYLSLEVVTLEPFGGQFHCLLHEIGRQPSIERRKPRYVVSSARICWPSSLNSTDRGSGLKFGGPFYRSIVNSDRFQLGLVQSPSIQICKRPPFIGRPRYTILTRPQARQVLSLTRVNSSRRGGAILTDYVFSFAHGPSVTREMWLSPLTLLLSSAAKGIEHKLGWLVASSCPSLPHLPFTYSNGLQRLAGTLSKTATIFRCSRPISKSIPMASSAV